jgi:glycosyltransferase involved in cell wall biosynthesis
MVIAHAGPSNLTIPASRGGAIERRMLALAVAQVQAYGQKVILYSVGEHTSVAEHEGVEIRYLKPSGRPGGRRAWFSWEVAKDIARVNPSIVHLHGRAEVAWLLRKMGVKSPIALACDNHLEPLARHALVAPLSRAAWSRFLRVEKCGICPVSEYCRSCWSTYWQIPVGQMRVVPNGVDLAHFSPSQGGGLEWRQRLGVREQIVALYVGRICTQKGSDLLIDAYRNLSGRIRNVALVMVGPPGQFGRSSPDPMLEELRRIGGIYVPPVSDQDLPSLYCAADFLVMPTRELEMFGMAAVEAQACGIPVLASDHGGLKETVPDGAGIRFLPNDRQDLEEKWARLAMDQELRRTLSKGARENARSYGWNEVARQYQEVYAELAS